ncbi:KamA family radical SAM protein [Lentisphaerota bacterium WC36G]|nr:KamA family radical SAM protein [Lentisphaerae bacterium WC36]
MNKTQLIDNCINKKGWQKIFADSFSDLQSLAEYLNVEIDGKISKVAKEYPVLVTKYYADLINKEDVFNDPIFKQCFPSAAELTPKKELSLDGLNETELMPTKRVIRKYNDRVVILTSNECAMHCRFCFRKRQWNSNKKCQNISLEEVDNIVKYLQQAPEISEVLLTGGDPLIMSDEKILKIIDKISECQNISVIRICTRMLVTLPHRMTENFAKELAKRSKVWIITHFNHCNELTPLSLKACHMLIQNGINVLNQSVLLKEVNDSTSELEKLFKELIANKIIPLYLFHIDPIKSVEHFATGVEKGLELMSELRSKTSSLATPTFAIDLPEGGGKVNLQPNFFYNGKFLGINNKKINYPFL